MSKDLIEANFSKVLHRVLASAVATLATITDVFPAGPCTVGPGEFGLTPKMIEAGTDIYWGFDLCECDPADVVRDIYEAMERAREV